jgi:hypothetical protein
MVEGRPWPGRFRKLCNCDEDGREIAPVDGREMPPVDGREIAPVDGREMPPVDGREIAPVDGREIAPVDGREIAPVDGRAIAPVDGRENDELGRLGAERLIDGLRLKDAPPRAAPPPPRGPRANTGSDTRQHATTAPTRKRLDRFTGILLL